MTDEHEQEINREVSSFQVESIIRHGKVVPVIATREILRN